MAEHRLSRNAPCPCGSGKKYKHCCIRLQAPGYSLENYSVRQPRQVPHDGAALCLTTAPPRNGAPRSDMPAARVGIEYEFDEPFGKAYVSYSFSVRRTIVLESGDATWVEFLQPGMRFKLEDGGIATVTKVNAPKIVMPPEDKTNEGGAKLKRVLGTIKRTGFVVIDLIAGNQTITTSPGHLFYSVTRRGWVGAGELQVGELLRNFRGGTTEVQAVSQPRYGAIEMYNLEVEDFHTFYVGRRETDAVLVHNGIEGLCNIVKPLGQEEAAQLSERVRFRIVRGDAKGRAFGTPRNLRVPAVEEFNPRVGELNVGDIGGAIKGRKHGIFPEQAESVSKMSNEELLRFRPDDPISGVIAGDGFSITGGHHRLNEIIRRVEAGTLPKDTKVRILFHD